MRLAKGTALWVAEQRGTAVFTRKGKVGAPGVPKSKVFRTEALATAFLEAERQRRLDEGFVVVDPDATLADPFTVDGAAPARVRPRLPAPFGYLANVVRTHVMGGFSTPAELDRILDDRVLTEVSAPETLRATLDRLVAVERAAERARVPPATRVNDALDAAFAELDGSGLVALQNAGFTQSDGWDDANEIAAERTPAPIGVVFYHFQDLERAVDGQGLWLTFGAWGEDAATRERLGLQVGQQVVDVLQKYGIDVAWTGKLRDRIVVRPFEWFRRGAAR